MATLVQHTLVQSRLFVCVRPLVEPCAFDQISRASAQRDGVTGATFDTSRRHGTFIAWRQAPVVFPIVFGGLRMYIRHYYLDNERNQDVAFSKFPCVILLRQGLIRREIEGNSSGSIQRIARQSLNASTTRESPPRRRLTGRMLVLKSYLQSVQPR